LVQIAARLSGGATVLVAVFILLSFQITIPQSGPGLEISRVSYAWDPMHFEVQVGAVISDRSRDWLDHLPRAAAFGGIMRGWLAIREQGCRQSHAPAPRGSGRLKARVGSP
jgi:hypothetical protein